LREKIAEKDPDVKKAPVQFKEDSTKQEDCKPGSSKHKKVALNLHKTAVASNDADLVQPVRRKSILKAPSAYFDFSKVQKPPNKASTPQIELS